MSEIIQKLLGIAQKSGNPALLDSPEELKETQNALKQELEGIQLTYDKPVNHYELNSMGKALQLIELSPNGRFRVNFSNGHISRFCDAEKQDCNLPLISVEGGAYDTVPVFSGAVPFFYVDYKPVSNEEWAKITEPLKQPAASSGEERENLRKAADLYKKFIAPADTGGWLGNLMPVRGEQDCTSSVSSLIPFLYTLSVQGLLKFHVMDLKRPMHGIPGFHYTALIRENSGDYFAIDAWEWKTQIFTLGTWNLIYGERYKDMRRPKF